MLKFNIERAITTELNPYFGPWSNWNIPTCDGYEGQDRYRQRYCTDGVDPKHPICCNNPDRKRFCKMVYTEPETETEMCEPQSYWSPWGEWKNKCTAKNEGRRISRTRKCTGGRAGQAPGCSNTIPLRRQVKRCGRP